LSVSEICIDTINIEIIHSAAEIGAVAIKATYILSDGGKIGVHTNGKKSINTG